jgi:hypothetical protein
MFTGSYDRARELARTALRSGELIGVIAAFPNPRSELFSDKIDCNAFDILRDMGVPTHKFESAWWGHFYPEFEYDKESVPWEHRAIKLTWDQADILLWNNIAREIGIRPAVPALSKLVNLEQGICVYAYDDRGMDITALTVPAIAELYRHYDSWLLDSDRPRMAQIFGSRQT